MGHGRRLRWGAVRRRGRDPDFLYDKPLLWLTTKNVGWIPKYGPTYGEIFWQDVYRTK